MSRSAHCLAICSGRTVGAQVYCTVCCTVYCTVCLSVRVSDRLPPAAAASAVWFSSSCTPSEMFTPGQRPNAPQRPF